MSGLRDTHALNATAGGGGRATTILSISCGEPGCDRSFGSESARASHLQYQHQIGIVDPLGFPCRVSTCSASFGTKANRDEHMHDVHKPGRTAGNDGRDAGLSSGNGVAAVSAPETRSPATQPQTIPPDVVVAASEPEEAPDPPEPEPGGEQAMAVAYACSDDSRLEPGEGCDEAFPTSQGRATHVTRVHLKPKAKARKTRRAPSRVQSNGHRRGDPAKNLVMLKLDRLQLEGLLELVRGAEASGDLNTSDPTELRREAGRLQLLATLQEATKGVKA